MHIHQTLTYSKKTNHTIHKLNTFSATTNMAQAKDWIQQFNKSVDQKTKTQKQNQVSASKAKPATIKLHDHYAFQVNIKKNDIFGNNAQNMFQHLHLKHKIDVACVMNYDYMYYVICNEITGYPAADIVKQKVQTGKKVCLSSQMHIYDTIIIHI